MGPKGAVHCPAAVAGLLFAHESNQCTRVIRSQRSKSFVCLPLPTISKSTINYSTFLQLDMDYPAERIIRQFAERCGVPRKDIIITKIKGEWFFEITHDSFSKVNQILFK